ncbi:hypothetical protein GCM10023085_15050 [Actinomadura viridis]|uniref:Hypervirulence associated protein TUDOR domain-containing protein n=1 Tax=Actinomadura viridis TaxID=58110 RepID=A0A931GPG2_9ACTN|nr:DUF2945 domain-containing protein [Actinomadura viridis]MBG6093875.1 hypothetical protein [Actinomadura viridis]
MAKSGRGKKPGRGGAPAAGDKATWPSHGADVRGTVNEEITERAEGAGREGAPSEDDRHMARGDKSGKKAVHKPSAMKHLKKKG